MDTLLPWRDAPDWQWCSDTLWHSNVAPLLSRVQVMSWKHTSHHHTTTTSLQCWHVAWLMHVLMRFSPYPSRPISMKHQEPGFIRPSNVFPVLQCPVFLFHSPLQPRVLVFAERNGTLFSRRLPYPIRVKVRRVVHSFMGLSASMLYWTVSWLTVARLLLCTICVSLLWPLSWMSRFWTLASRWLNVLWVVDHSWHTR